jgi:hypothetical protein
MSTTEQAAVRIGELPTIGAALAGGLYAGVTTLKTGELVAVVLLSDKPSQRLDWAAAKAWASEVGGELPSRPVSALLYAQLKTQFEPHWHWTSEQHEDDGAYAWDQHFSYGYQCYDFTSYEARVRAVRLIPLTA